MIIEKVKTKEEAIICDELLTKLILDEKKYNKNINVISIIDYYPNLYLKDNNTLFIAKQDNKIVGYIFIKELNDPTNILKEAIIDALYVEEEYRNNGIAKSLIEKAKNYCSNNNIKYISLNVMYQNEIAKKLYYNLGFKKFSLNLKSEVN